MADFFSNSHAFVRTVAADKARGTLIGSALGDALGLYTEFLSKSRATQQYPQGIVFGSTELCGDMHRDKFAKGSWTDDTDHALLLVLSYLHFYGENQKAPPMEYLAQDFATRLNCWCEQGLLALSEPARGLGQTIGTVATAPQYLDNPKAMGMKIWMTACADSKPASNGSLMRAYPLGVIAASYDSEEDAYQLAVEISRTTHAEPRCSLACCAFVAILRGIIRGEILNETDLDQILIQVTEYVQATPKLLGSDFENEDVQQWLQLDEFREHTNSSATFESLKLDETWKIGYIYKCLGAGIVVLRLAMRGASEADTFKDLMLTLTMEGGDADTNGAVAGALLGAWLGESKLPVAFTNKLNHYDWLHRKAVRFVYASGIQDQVGGQAWAEQKKDNDTDIYGGRQPLTKEELIERKYKVLQGVDEKHAKRKEENVSQIQPKGWRSRIFQKVR